jgi:hypothetical protein
MSFMLPFIHGGLHETNAACDKCYVRKRMRKQFVLVLRVVKDEFLANKKVANLAPINHFII